MSSPATLPELVPLLQALVRIPSPNPPGDTRAIASFICEILSGIADVQQLAPPEKPEAVSVVASIGSGEPVILLHAHIDTVPVADEESKRWSVDPYAAVIQDARLYGKGSIDDKAPLAAMLRVFLETSIQPALHGTLVLVAAAEEEVGGRLGTRWMADHGHLPDCDFIVVGEQTANRVATAHKGVLRATVRAVGRSVHATNPDRGINAITAMAHAVLSLAAYHDSLRSRVHPLVGHPTCNVGVIHGGSTANAVPDSCVVYLDRRMIPGEDPAKVQAELQAVISGVEVAPAQLSIGDFLVSDWFDSTCNSSLAHTFLNCVREELKSVPGPIGYLPGSDAKHLTGLLRARGGEMIIFGPGSYEVAHAIDEHVELTALESTAEILRQFMQQTLYR